MGDSDYRPLEPAPSPNCMLCEPEVGV